MKKLNYLFLLLGVLTLGSCTETIKDTITYNVNEPIFMSKSEFRNSVRVSVEPQPIVTRGKICFYEGYLYISEPEKGIHIFDNRDPKNPKNIGFVELVGNGELAIRNNTLYADSYVDLVWFDVSNPAQPNLLGRKADMFPYALPDTDNSYGYDYEQINNKGDNNIIVGWKVKEKTVSVEKGYGGIWWGSGMTDGALMSDGGKTSSTGVNGSMSRFTFYSDYLYSVFQNQISIFEFEDKEPVKAANEVYVGWNVETIFSYKNNLFMGTPTGMLIYSVADPLNPVYQSSVQHVYGCDPVVVENDIAYVTVHSGDNCGQNVNQLIIIDVKDVASPKAVVTYSMTKPMGLAISNNTLFVCDDGLKIFDATNPQTIMANQLAYFQNMNGYDVIALDNVLMMIASDGIYQYDYSNPKDITLLSKYLFAL